MHAFVVVEIAENAWSLLEGYPCVQLTSLKATALASPD